MFEYFVHVINNYPMGNMGPADREMQDRKLISEKRKQPGVTFPSASKQEHLLIIRLNLQSSAENDISRVRSGLRTLCRLFERIDNGAVKIDELQKDGSIEQYPMSRYNFSATIGFGAGFFKKLNITKNKPGKIYEMPDNRGLKDPLPYTLVQTDLLIQLGSNKQYVNRMVLQNDSYLAKYETDVQAQTRSFYGGVHPWVGMNSKYEDGVLDIVTATEDWAYVTDVHSGFQRLDGRNLMGFDDGISNPDRLRNNIVWTGTNDEVSLCKEGTYMVFQKISHDLEQWRTLNLREQERWIGRSKATGLFLGTLSRADDEKLALQCRSVDPIVRREGRTKLKRLLKEQRDPEKRIFDTPKYNNISIECPVWSHVRKSNPRGVDGVKPRIIFRRGYLFMEDTIGGKLSSGLLFICFQKDISAGFEYIKKNFLNNQNFPVPEVRKDFNRQELSYRQKHGYTSDGKMKEIRSPENLIWETAQQENETTSKAGDDAFQNTGKEGLAGPSQLGVLPAGGFVATLTLGGGYYFIPPIPSKKVSEIGQQFFR